MEDDHSSDVEEIHDLTDLDKCRINNENDSPYEYERRSFTSAKDGRCASHKKGDVYGSESIVRRRFESDVYGDIRRTDDLKFKCRRDGRCRSGESTMANRVYGALVAGLILATLTTCAAAPARSRTTRSSHEKTAVSLLQNYKKYLKKHRYNPL